MPTKNWNFEVQKKCNRIGTAFSLFLNGQTTDHVHRVCVVLALNDSLKVYQNCFQSASCLPSIFFCVDNVPLHQKDFYINLHYFLLVRNHQRSTSEETSQH